MTEIWNIDDIIQDYENQGFVGRSKQDYLQEVKQKLEKLEYYEKIFTTPLIEIRKQLEILDIIKRYYRFNQHINEDLLVLKKPITYEDSEIIKEWIEIDKNKDLYKDMFYRGGEL